MEGAKKLAAKVRRYRPKIVAFLGVGAYRHAFGVRTCAVGRQPKRLEGAEVWVLPNPSGLNANYQLPDLVKLFRRLRRCWYARCGRKLRKGIFPEDELRELRSALKG